MGAVREACLGMPKVMPNSELASSQERVELWLVFLYVVWNPKKLQISLIISSESGETCPKWLKQRDSYNSSMNLSMNLIIAFFYFNYCIWVLIQSTHMGVVRYTICIMSRLNWVGVQRNSKLIQLFQRVNSLILEFWPQNSLYLY